LQNPQESNLSVQWQLADFVQENGSAIGQLEAAQPGLCGASECAFLVTKQLGRNQRRRQCGTANANKGVFSPRRSLMDRSRNQLFSGAGLPGD
jgi:hypothetical protein